MTKSSVVVKIPCKYHFYKKNNNKEVLSSWLSLSLVALLLIGLALYSQAVFIIKPAQVITNL